MSLHTWVAYMRAVNAFATVTSTQHLQPGSNVCWNTDTTYSSYTTTG